MKASEVLVIDLFAGPGGLGEGISSYVGDNGLKPFQISVSVEKEPSAHRTLTTRAFFRKIADNPDSRNDYYDYVKGHISRDQLFELHPKESQAAIEETLNGPKALGVDNELIHERIKTLTSNHKGPTIVIGGPPCQAYSLAGRSRNAGNKEYKAEEDHRHFLYKEYLQVLSIAKPDIFVMENVRGILSAKLDGKLMFPEILEDLQQPGKVTETEGVLGYRIYSLVTEAEDPHNPAYKKPADFLIRSEDYIIPQARHRVILLGVREDLKQVPGTLKAPEKAKVTVKEALDDLPPLRSGFSKQKDNSQDWTHAVSSHAKKLKKIFSRPFKDQVNQLDLEPLTKLERRSTEHKNAHNSALQEPLRSWLLDEKLNYVLNHETRGHMKDDLLRYAFCAAYSQLNNGISPKSRDFPSELAPSHANWETGKHADRFRVQSANKPATTVTSHISKDGHYFVHYDPKQCRSLTVREAARLQTFPDNYFFEGNRTQQYVQVGNAVPPFLAQQIAKVLAKAITI